MLQFIYYNYKKYVTPFTYPIVRCIEFCLSIAHLLNQNWSPMRCPSVEQTPQPMKTQLKPMPLTWPASLPQLFAAVSNIILLCIMWCILR